jgi:hypothetical protein
VRTGHLKLVHALACMYVVFVYVRLKTFSRKKIGVLGGNEMMTRIYCIAVNLISGDSQEEIIHNSVINQLSESDNRM